MTQVRYRSPESDAGHQICSHEVAKSFVALCYDTGLMQELDEGAAWPGPTAVRRRIAWEYPSEARPNDGERGCLRALRGAAAGTL